jgi:RNA polymerase sigma-70 factor (ECF subfamily)
MNESQQEELEGLKRLYPLDDRDEGVSADDLERLWTDIRRFIDSGLTEQDRRVLLLRFDEGCTYREIGRRLGISEAAVYKHLAQALRRLRLHFRKNEQLTIG